MANKIQLNILNILENFNKFKDTCINNFSLRYTVMCHVYANKFKALFTTVKTKQQNNLLYLHCYIFNNMPRKYYMLQLFRI